MEDSKRKIQSALCVVREITLRREERIRVLEAENAALRKQLEELERNVDIIHTRSMRLSHKKLFFIHPTPPATQTIPKPVVSRRASVSRGITAATAAEALSSLEELKIKSAALRKIINEVKNPLRLCFNTSTNTLTVEYVVEGEVELTRSYVIFTEKNNIDLVKFWARLPNSPVIIE